MYIDKDTTWQQQHFKMLHDIVFDQSYYISQEWVMDLNTREESLSFQIGDHTYPAHLISPITRKKLPISKADFDAILNSVKG